VAITRADFPLPDLTDPLSAPFFAAAAAGELRIPRCEDCGAYVWYPQETCPADGGVLVWTRVSGRGTLFSWAVVRRAFLPAFEDKVPFVTALVALEEDPAVRIATYIVDTDPDALVPDAPVEVEFRDLSFSTVPDTSVVVPMFRERR
jgi:uncharacterized OB-fold protein